GGGPRLLLVAQPHISAQQTQPSLDIVAVLFEAFGEPRNHAPHHCVPLLGRHFGCRWHIIRARPRRRDTLHPRHHPPSAPPQPPARPAPAIHERIQPRPHPPTLPPAAHAKPRPLPSAAHPARQPAPGNIATARRAHQGRARARTLLWHRR